MFLVFGSLKVIISQTLFNLSSLFKQNSDLDHKGL